MQGKDLIKLAASAVVGAVCAFVINNVGNGVLTLTSKASGAASQEAVQRLEQKVDRLPTGEDLREFKDELSQFNEQLSQLRSDVRLVSSDVDTISETQIGLRDKQRYLWDSVTQICTKIDMVCATRNASLFGLPMPGPMPLPAAYVLAAACHEKRQTWGLPHVT